MHLLLLVMYSLIQTCSSLHCYTCISSKEEACTPKKSDCGVDMQGSCMTLLYTTKKDNKDITRFQKGCWDSFTDCMKHCKSREMIRESENCQVSCCKTDLCNEGGLKKKDFQEKKKRSNIKYNAATSLVSAPSSYVSSVIIGKIVLFLLARYLAE